MAYPYGSMNDYDKKIYGEKRADCYFAILDIIRYREKLLNNSKKDESTGVSTGILKNYLEEVNKLCSFYTELINKQLLSQKEAYRNEEEFAAYFGNLAVKVLDGKVESADLMDIDIVEKMIDYLTPDRLTDLHNDLRDLTAKFKETETSQRRGIASVEGNLQREIDEQKAKEQRATEEKEQNEFTNMVEKVQRPRGEIVTERPKGFTPSS